MLKPTLPGETATLVLTNGAMPTQACFPAAWQRVNLAGLQRPPGFEGKQQFVLAIPQDGCVNSTSPEVPYMRRCWADKSTLVDYVVLGADGDAGGGTVANNLLVFVRNFTALCRVRVDEGCLELHKQPLVCYLSAVNSVALDAATPTSTAGAGGGGPSASAAAGSGPSAAATVAAGGQSSAATAATAGGEASGGLGGRKRLAVAVSVSLAGGVVLAVLLAAAVMVALWRRRSLAYSSSKSLGAASASTAAAGGPLLALASASVDPGPARSESAKSGGKVAAGSSPAGRHPPAGLAVGVVALSLQPGATTATVAGDSLSDLSSRFQDCTEETLLHSCEDDRSLGKTRDGAAATAAPAAACGGGGIGGGGQHGYYGNRTGGGGDGPVTPFTPHRLSLDLRVALECAAVADITGGFEHGDFPANAKAGSIKVYSMYSTASFTLIDGSASAASGSGAAAAAVAAAAAANGGDGSAAAAAASATSSAVVAASGDAEDGDAAAAGDGTGGSEAVGVVELLPTVLGKGAYGRVHEGVYGGHRVAVKVMASLHPGAGGDSLARSFAQEVQVLHIVANALAYLHPTIVHRDLKPANVLVDNAGSDRPVVKISDFGLSRLRITVVPTETPEAGTDMFSFGVLLWEMLSGERPWWRMQPVAVALMVSHHGSRLPVRHLLPERRPVKLAKLLVACWEEDPSRRPAAAEVAKQLTVLLQELAVNGLLAPAAAADEALPLGDNGGPFADPWDGVGRPREDAAMRHSSHLSSREEDALGGSPH